VKGLMKATQNLRFAWDAYCHWQKSHYLV
jgi:hypothetical protein